MNSSFLAQCMTSKPGERAHAVHCGSPLSVELDLCVPSAYPDFSKSAQVMVSFCAVDLFFSIKSGLYVKFLDLFNMFQAQSSHVG